MQVRQENFRIERNVVDRLFTNHYKAKFRIVKSHQKDHTNDESLPKICNTTYK